MSISFGFFILLLIFLLWTGRGGCGCLLVILAIIGGITIL